MDGWGLGKSDPYVILELDGNRICRSKTIEDNLNPVWNQPVVLQLCSSYRELKFTIYDEDNCSKDDAIGTVIVPTESFANGTLLVTNTTSDGCIGWSSNEEFINRREN